LGELLQGGDARLAVVVIDLTGSSRSTTASATTSVTT
jgi:hypothetical protein